jgi:hypothetical protein
VSQPPEDDIRSVAIARPDDPALTHLAVVGDTHTVLFSGEQTAGRFAMLDMLIPPGGGPPPHRHDFEECFRVLEGSVRVGDLPLFGWRQVSQRTSRPTPLMRSATRQASRPGCCAPSRPRVSRSTSPSSATPSPRAPPLPRRSATRSARSGCGKPSHSRPNTAWSSCFRPRSRARVIAAGEVLRNGAATNVCGHAPVTAGQPEPCVPARQWLEELAAEHLGVAGEHLD